MLSTAQDPLLQLIQETFDEKSLLFERSLVQEGAAWRAVHTARRLADLLFDEKGKLKKEEVQRAEKLLKEHLYPLNPNRREDLLFADHLLSMVHSLKSNKRCEGAFKKIHRPEGHEVGHLVRRSLLLPASEPLTDRWARVAVCAALFSFLRQNVGSCFATAPAILILAEQPHLFLEDMVELFGTGKLRRVQEGVEFTVPLSVSTGEGDLLKPFYLKQLGEDAPEKLLLSPGLASALEAAGLKKEESRKALRTLLSQERKAPFAPLIPKEMLRQLLLRHFGLKEEEVNRPTRMHEASLGLFMVVPPSQRGKSALINRFKEAFQRAQEAFQGETENPLLKAWEFTLASFAEAKADFTKWNLYASLGMHPDESGGIGEALYAVLQEEIARVNEELKAYESRQDHVAAQMTSLQGRANHAQTEKEMGWIQAEYQMRKFEMGRLQAEAGEIYQRGERASGLLPKLQQFYMKQFQTFFQEVYDAKMQGLEPNPYEDSPAGFRLVCKHGRSHPGAWTWIYTPEEYQQALAAFFMACERELIHDPQFERLEPLLSRLTSGAVRCVRTREFLESSFERLARAYHEAPPLEPLENLEQVKRKPWAYLSGGTMGTLVATYFTAPKLPTEKSLWIENVNELMAFLIDSAKELPHGLQKEIRNQPEKALLMHSPTHAFLFKPGLKPFRAAWDENDTYTYTWIRDMWAQPRRRFLDECVLSLPMMEALGEWVKHLVPEGAGGVVEQLVSKLPPNATAPEFRRDLIEGLSYDPWMRYPGIREHFTAQLDGFLFRTLPLFPAHLLKERLRQVFEATATLSQDLKGRALERCTDPKGGWMRAEELRHVALRTLEEAYGHKKGPHCFYRLVTQAMQSLGLCSPEPLLFADSNWVDSYFGFTVGPGTGELELWRFNPFGTSGEPMRQWAPYLDGRDTRKWVVYVNPYEYTSK